MPGGRDMSNDCKHVWYHNGVKYVEEGSAFWWSWLPLWQRILLMPVYLAYVAYLCLKGEIIEVVTYKKVEEGEKTEH